MSVYNQIAQKRTFIGKLDYGSDLLEELISVCQKEDIYLGKVDAIGAVQKARLAYYDQKERKYHFFQIDKHLEIAGLLGNISIRDGKPMVHAHITLADKDGHAYGGHLAPGTTIFACEFIIKAYDGPEYVREQDEETGLPLWKI